jgi:hypothetical protein
MRRVVLAISTAALLVVAVPTAVLADAGTPGSTFPEQPSGNVSTACATVVSNPGTGVGGAAGENGSDTALAITGGLLADACS